MSDSEQELEVPTAELRDHFPSMSPDKIQLLQKILNERGDEEKEEKQSDTFEELGELLVEIWSGVFGDE